MPKIEDLLFGIREYEYLTRIDISMQHYAFWLDEESSWYCVFSTPFGKYKLNRLGMGCVQSGDIAQAAMEEIFRDLLHVVKVYMDDILFHHTDWDEHLLKSLGDYKSLVLLSTLSNVSGVLLRQIS